MTTAESFDDRELELFLSDGEDQSELREKQALVFEDTVLAILGKLTTNDMEEVKVSELEAEISKLSLDKQARAFLDLVCSMKESYLPKDAVITMWMKIKRGKTRGSKRSKSAGAISNGGERVPIVKNRILESKRKEAECELKLLQNRIFLLQVSDGLWNICNVSRVYKDGHVVIIKQQEETRAWKKISQTKDRAREILEQREANVKKNEQKNQTAIERVQATRRAVKKHHSLKKESIFKKKHAAIQVISKKFQDVEEVKSERKRLKEEKERQQLMEVEKAKEKREVVRKQEEELRRKRQRERELHERDASVRYMKKAVEEERRIREQQRKVQEMERAELELIKRLQDTQLIQKEAYTVLEQALINTETTAGQPSHKNREE